MSGSANSSVGSRQLYEANDQRTSAQDEINDRERFKEGQPGSHQSNDSSECFSPPPPLSSFAQKEVFV
jgi:hypothetical protein